MIRHSIANLPYPVNPPTDPRRGGLHAVGNNFSGSLTPKSSLSSLSDPPSSFVFAFDVDVFFPFPFFVGLGLVPSTRSDAASDSAVGGFHDASTASSSL